MKNKTGKKILCGLLVMMLIPMFASCGDNEPSPYPNRDDDAVLSQCRQAMTDYSMMGAVSYLGWYEGEMGSDEFYQSFPEEIMEFPFLSDLDKKQLIDVDGYELYAFIPADPEASVTVSHWIINEENDYLGEAGDVIYSSETGDPIIIRCNVSEFVPNVVINITDSTGRSLEYNPCLNGMDGGVVIPFDEELGQVILFDYTMGRLGAGDNI